MISDRAEPGLARRGWRHAAKLVLLSGATLLAALLVCELVLRAAGFSYHLRPEQIQFGWPRTLASLGEAYRGDPDLLWVHSDYAQRLARARAGHPAIVFLGDSCTNYSRY